MYILSYYKSNNFILKFSFQLIFLNYYTNKSSGRDLSPNRPCQELKYRIDKDLAYRTPLGGVKGRLYNV